jgi:hypothetical protein
MNFTFGIITSQKDALNSLSSIIDSIKNLNIPNYEIIIIGGDEDYKSQNISIYSFEENPNGWWITKKKNLITKYAKYSNIVYLHDYIIFDKDWYKNFLNFGDNFNICMTQILNPDDTRFRDWCLWAESATKIGIPYPKYLVPYNFKYLSKVMYISGTYWIAKKQVMEEFPLNENLFWGQGEDVEWSKNVTKKYNFSINPNAIVKLMGHKDPLFHLCNDLDKLNSINDSKQFHNN